MSPTGIGIGADILQHSKYRKQCHLLDSAYIFEDAPCCGNKPPQHEIRNRIQGELVTSTSWEEQELKLYCHIILAVFALINLASFSRYQ